MTHLARIVSCINSLNLQLRLKREDMKKSKHFPPGGLLHRGGGLPDEHFGFYQEGKEFRVPGFLATSVSDEVANGFMVRARAREENAVLWRVFLDERGATQPRYQCMHVNFVEKSNVEGEEEFLFAPYSPFTVRKVIRGNGSTTRPHVIELEAGLDSREYAEDLPLAPWI
uniref:NAD(+)--protein-arginine ADP-ribosyltransferase n=1 Tax=Hemiselmis andersenii TaxID=464988 RepID=A0A6U4TLV5_HEMAN|mmetsp:Transcript_9842/g.22962  ORF Transcript_9842/g.22962 Transcript_9842/m.22962 type:complete len:170 (-) Transcript_9842:346-855(-)